MIVISGALVFVALVLLVIGLVSPDLAFVYASIGVSLASFGFLVVGILQRRKEDVSGEPASPVPGTGAVKAGLGAVVRAGDKALGRDNADAATTGVTTLPPVYKATPGDTSLTSGTVLVVAGRPRYHVEGCRYLTGKEADTVDVGKAREEGFSACGVCKPDDNLGSAVGAEVVEEVEVTGEAPVSPARVTRATAPGRKAAAAVPAKPSAARVSAAAPSKSAPARSAAAKTVAAKVAKPAPAKTSPAKAVPAKKAAPAPVKRGGVIVIPDRGRYHTAECRYVRGADGTLELTKAAATKQGYVACGVCNP